MLLNVRHFSVAFAFLTILFSSCQDDEQVNQPEQSVSINGYVQKGPFINGTAITVSELDQKLVATGKNFTTQIIDNKGAFSLRDVKLQSDFVQLIAEGFYFDEVRGEKSAAQLTLFALANVSNVSSVNVNLLSHLEKDRVTYLMQEEEKSFTTAKQQAQREILAIFGIEKTDMTTSELLDISRDGDDNAILLAISAILQGNNTVAELSELLADIITDIREDGVLNSESTREKIRINALALALADIRQHLKVRYEELGVDATIPNFEKYVDSDGDGFLNKDEDDTPDDFAFESLIDAAVDTLVISNEVVISGLKEGGKTVAQLRSGKFADNSLEASDDSIYSANLINEVGLLVNGQPTDNRTTVQVGNGDRLQIAVQSSGETATTKKASLIIGSISRIFEVTTDDYTPGDFDFTSIMDAKRDSLYTSETITLSGLPHSTFVTLDNGELVVNETEATSNQAMLRSGDKVAIRLFASSNYETKVSATLQIGAVSKTFTVRSRKNPWQQKADIPIRDFFKKRWFMIGSDLYIIDFSNSSMYTYKADQGNWTNQGISIPPEFEEDRYGMVCFTIRDKAYIGLGGYTKNIFDDTNDKVVYTYRDFWEFNPVAASWTRKSDFPGENVNEATSFIINNEAYITTGYYDDLNYKNDFYEDDYLYTKQTWKYNSTADQWTRRSDFPGKIRKSATSFGFNGKGLLGGGNLGYYRITVEGFWEYNPTNDNWTSQTSFVEELKLGQYNGSCAFFSSNSELYFITTYDETYFKKYDSVNNLWHSVELPDNFLSVGVLSNSQKTYVLDRAYEGAEPFVKLWEFTPPQE